MPNVKERGRAASGQARNRVRHLAIILRTTIESFSRNHGAYGAASISFYAVFSFFPLLIVPLICVAALLSAGWLMIQGRWWPAWFASGLTIFTATAFGVIGLYPDMLPSTISPDYSLTAFNSASSPLTLTIMLVVALIFVPIVLLYQIWAYRIFRDKVTPEKIVEEGWY